jgi:hypothetical protein
MTTAHRHGSTTEHRRHPDHLGVIGFARDFALTPVEGCALPTDPNQGGTHESWCDAPQNKPIVLITKPMGGGRDFRSN